MQGFLVVKVRSAVLTHDTDIGKMDPYAVIKIGAKKERTKTHKKAGKTPKWEETFKIPGSVGDVVDYEVWDEESLSSDDFVGSGSFCISQLHVLNKNELDFELKYEKGKKKAGSIILEIEFIPAPKQEPKPVEERKETDFDAIVKLQAELDKVWEVIEEKREQAKPVQPQQKKKDFSALENEIKKLRAKIMSDKTMLERQDLASKGTEEKFRAFLEEHKAQKLFLENEHTMLNQLRITVLPGILSVTVSDGEVNNKSDKDDTVLALICGEQVKEFKNKALPGKNPEWKETCEFKITTEATVGFLVYSPEKNGVRTLGVGAQSLYHVSHDNLAEKAKVRLLLKDIEIGSLNIELLFKGL